MQNATLSATDCISAVYDSLDRPGQDVLPASIVCAHMWFALDIICLRVGLSDRTFFMTFRDGITGPLNATEINLGEMQFFGNELALEIIDTTSGVERKTPIELIEDMRDLPMQARLCAVLYRQPGSPTVPILRFNMPLPGTFNFRLYWEPSTFSRPQGDEVPIMPGEATTFLVALTSRKCLTRVKAANVIDKEAYAELKDRVLDDVKMAAELFEEYMTRDNAGAVHRTAFNELRRSTGRYGSRRWDGYYDNFPIIGAGGGSGRTG